MLLIVSYVGLYSADCDRQQLIMFI